ncbi:hypothetical protein SDC9_192646 [bioreactor metagenome]|uniref:Uncharacterized protein n=1 Tax=bioreactor metagenome TaxID=1076179 RepID=A0A645I3P1_9ZZZZ
MPQAFAVDEQIILLARQCRMSVLDDELAVRGTLEDAREQALLELPCQRCPVASRHFKAAVDHRLVSVGVYTQTGIALLAADVRTADGGHEELLVIRVELDLKKALQALLLLQCLNPPRVDVLGQLGSHGICLFGAMGPLEPNKDGVSVSINNFVSALFDQIPCELHHFVAT